MKHKFIKVIIVVTVVAVGIWLFGGCDRTPDYDAAKVEALNAKTEYSQADLADMLEQAKAIGGLLRDEDETRSDDEQARLLEIYVNYQDILQANTGRMTPETLEDYNDWLDDTGADE